MSRNFILVALLGVVVLTSCNRDLVNEPTVEQSLREVSAKEQSKEKFANILSKATYERTDVREFLKKEAVKQFDKNYDVFYPLVKGENIGGETFRDILISYSSKEEIEEIESNVPLLNILIPRIAMFDVNPEELDIHDKEIPVAISKDWVTALYLNGKKEMDVKKGQVPDFHVIVVNENTRVAPIESVELKAGLQQSDIKGIRGSSYAFKSPNYDGTRVSVQPQSAWATNRNIIGERAIDAYKYFYKNDSGINQKALQRDYIYYGITPQNQQGSLNRSVSEYISFIEVNPAVYYQISDQTGTGLSTDDPYIWAWETDQERRGLEHWELVNRMWSRGSYEFEFLLTKSTKDTPDKFEVPIFPDQIWNFNIGHWRKHGSFWRRSKNFYWINPQNFTSKQVWLKDLLNLEIPLGRWDISKESLYRYIDVYEKDEEGIMKNITTTYETDRVTGEKFKKNVKVGMGLEKDVKINGDVSISISVDNTNTVKEVKTISVEKREKSDFLGRIEVYFYDPVIIGKSGNQYEFKTYSTGKINIGLTVK